MWVVGLWNVALYFMQSPWGCFGLRWAFWLATLGSSRVSSYKVYPFSQLPVSVKAVQERQVWNKHHVHSYAEKLARLVFFSKCVFVLKPIPLEHWHTWCYVLHLKSQFICIRIWGLRIADSWKKSVSEWDSVFCVSAVSPHNYSPCESFSVFFFGK